MIPTASFSAAALYVGALTLVLLALALLVVGERRRARIGIGDGGDAHLLRAIRVHGNAVENALPAMIALIALALIAAPVWLIHIVGIAAVGGRVAHAIGFRGSAGISMGRAIGMSLSWLALGLAGGALIVLGVRGLVA